MEQTKELLFANGSYLMVMLDDLPNHEKINNYIKNIKNLHITIKYNPLLNDIELYNLEKLGETVNVLTKSISISEKNIIRIDVDIMLFNNNTILNKLDNGVCHITINVPNKYKPIDANYFEPIEIYEYTHVLKGIYCLMDSKNHMLIFNL